METAAINGEKKLTSTVEQPLQRRSSMPTPNGGEEARTTTRGGDGGARRKKTGARKKKMERVKEMAACSFFLNLKQGNFCPFTLNAGCTLLEKEKLEMVTNNQNRVIETYLS